MFYAHARLDCTLARSHLLLLLGKCFTPADQALKYGQPSRPEHNVMTTPQKL